MIFKMYNCDFGIKIAGVRYDFDHVENLQVEDPEETKLTRGSNGNSKMGLVYKEGIKDPKRITVTIIGMSPELKAVLDDAYENKTRVDVFCTDRTDGSGKIGRNSILGKQPMQLNVDDSPESMNVALVFSTYDYTESHKS